MLSVCHGTAENKKVLHAESEVYSWLPDDIDLTSCPTSLKTGEKCCWKSIIRFWRFYAFQFFFLPQIHFFLRKTHFRLPNEHVFNIWESEQLFTFQMVLSTESMYCCINVTKILKLYGSGIVGKISLILNMVSIL